MAVEREQYVGIGQRGDQDGLVLGHVEGKWPVEGEFVTFNGDATTKRSPSTGCIGWLSNKVVADFMQNPW